MQRGSSRCKENKAQILEALQGELDLSQASDGTGERGGSLFRHHDQIQAQEGVCKHRSG